MTIQIPAARQDELATQLALRIEQRLDRLADDLEHAEITVYGTDRGLATRGNVIRMSLADLAAVVAETALLNLEESSPRGLADARLRG